jgi:chromosome segregation and condensation protein ScpB
VVRNLLDHNLLAEVGRELHSPGTPALLDTTEDFLLSAGAESRNEFPALEELVDPEEISRIRKRLGGDQATETQPGDRTEGVG